MIFWNLTDNLTPFVLVWPFYCLWVASVPLARWQLSYLDRGKLYILGSGGWMCTSASLEHGQQASLLVTWAEVALLWGALVPVLLPAVLLATGTNMLMCKVGHGHFGVDRLDRAATGMSRRYLHGSLCVLVCFQNWFAWSSGMHGRWLLLLTALIYVLELGGFLSFGFVQTRSVVAIVDDRCPHSNGDNDVEMIRRKRGPGQACRAWFNGEWLSFSLLPTHLNLHAFGPGCPWHCDVMPSFFKRQHHRTNVLAFICHVTTVSCAAAFRLDSSGHWLIFELFFSPQNENVQ